MTVHWEVYEIYDPEVDRPLAEVSRPEARRHFQRLMANREQRIAELKRLLGASGIDLDGSDESIQALNDWFALNVEADPADRTRLRGRWYSVVQDIALYLGELMISRFRHLEWKMDLGGKRNLSYQRPVLAGFRRTHPRYTADLDYAVGVYGHELVGNRNTDRDLFLAMLRATDEDA